MQRALLACVVLAMGVAAQQQPETEILETKPATRTLPADQLRDFPGLCFGSTTFKFYAPGTTWVLELFCGQSECLQNATGLYEKVDDCGPAPKPNDKCTPIFPEQGTVFPGCCPRYRCLVGTKLEFPTPEEIRAAAEKARQEQAAAREQAEKEAAAAQAQA